jgi:hypothetical protein
MSSGVSSLVSAAEEGELNPLVPQPFQVLALVLALFLLVAIVVAVLVARSRRARGGAQERLAEVDRLHAAGRIDDAERVAARQRILDGI